MRSVAPVCVKGAREFTVFRTILHHGGSTEIEGERERATVRVRAHKTTKESVCVRARACARACVRVRKRGGKGRVWGGVRESERASRRESLRGGEI